MRHVDCLLYLNFML
ncbi:hypothetical protein YPPY14_2775, partial [Yersinia pestis PY-14]